MRTRINGQNVGSKWGGDGCFEASAPKAVGKRPQLADPDFTVDRNFFGLSVRTAWVALELL
ncbi:hypothetical protein [Variovorax paradoxus]|uniref:hypothetical protein n=1 Tax=Variovorax paradoxus TaxID=34073 RepID=UPI003D6495CF